MKTTPHHFLFLGNGQPEGEDWWDGDSVCGFPVYNGTDMLRHSVSGDEDCPFMPIWEGEFLFEHSKDVRIFQLSYANSGDFPS